ncbi:23497_t:CDS:2, partial [Dentiscutata erythropus]
QFEERLLDFFDQPPRLSIAESATINVLDIHALNNIISISTTIINNETVFTVNIIKSTSEKSSQ